MTFEGIIRKPQHALKKALISELNRMGYKTTTKKGFVYAKGNIPVLLVAHLDTAHREPVKAVCYSPDGKIIMSPQGIGGDDRAGVYMVLEIIKKHRCHVLFCEDEEIGGIGAHEFIKNNIKPEINYIVELDRHGSNDAVFYDCDNPDFTEFVCGFGFKEDFGSFSDISIIAPHLGVAAVNISAGYYNEHSLHEYVDMDVVKNNIGRVCKMVSTPSEEFKYIEVLTLSRRSLSDNRYYSVLYSEAYDEDYWEELSFIASSFGYSTKDIDRFRTLGYPPDVVEEILYYGEEIEGEYALTCL